MPITPTKKIWMDGELVDWENASIHVLTHSVHYGWAVFEGIRAYDTPNGSGVFRLTDHMKRLYRSAKIYCMEPDISVEESVQAVKDLIVANEISTCYIRPLVYLGYGEIGLNPLPSKVRMAIACWPWGAYLGEEAFKTGVRAMISSWRRLDNNMIPPQAKACGQYLNSSLAKVEAVKGGYDEAILLNNQGYVSDGTGENVFVVRDGIIYTPGPHAGCLGGITRDSIMEVARDLGYEVREVDMVRTDLYLADEAFFTGTAAEVVPIREVDDRVIGPAGPITRRLMEAFHNVVRGQDDRYKNWVELVR